MIIFTHLIKTDLFNQRLGKIYLIACIRADQRCIQDPFKIFVRIISNVNLNTTQKLKFSIKDFSSECDQIRSFLRIWSHLLEKPLMENFTFCAVLGAWLGPECTSVGRYNTVFKTQADISSWKQVAMTLFKSALSV